MALDSSSTVAEAQAQLKDNAGFVNNPTKAAAWLEARTWLKAGLHSTSSDGDSINYGDDETVKLAVATAAGTGSGDRRRLGKLGVSHG